MLCNTIIKAPIDTSLVHLEYGFIQISQSYLLQHYFFICGGIRCSLCIQTYGRQFMNGALSLQQCTRKFLFHSVRVDRLTLIYLDYPSA